MTRETIMAAKAGRELNRLICELLGWTYEKREGPGVLGAWKDSKGVVGFEWKDDAGDDYSPSTSITQVFDLQAEIERRGLASAYVDELIEIANDDVWRTLSEDQWLLINASAEVRARAAAIVLLENREAKP